MPVKYPKQPRTDYECITVETDREGITWMTFNRPEKRNAMNPTLHAEMAQAMLEHETHPETKVIVLTGAGNSWSAGMDLKEYFRETDGDAQAQFRSYTDNRRWSWDALVRGRKPVIAMVNGYCFGGAFIPLCNCDLAIAADDAIFGLSEINWGIVPGGVVSKLLVDTLRIRDAMYYAVTGRTFDGKKAAQMGLVNFSVPSKKLRAETVALARELMSKSPMVLAYTKQAIRQVRTMDMEQAYDYLIAKITALEAKDTEHTRERGMREFLDKKSFKPGLGAVARPGEKATARKSTSKARRKSPKK
ncbi:MAG: p-hydroxycinnamoyl CoA hydratase/lyase [Betaproteobacteria bacterium]